MARPSFTLFRSTFLDLLKLVALTATVLVLVIALGAAIKPLSDGVLSAGDLPKFVLIAMVPMLAYALPFAGGFASTLVYHRIASDNEAVAAHAGGISHRALLGPALALALVLTGGLMLLNEQVIPVFLRTMQKMVTVDVARKMLQGTTRGEAVEFRGGMGGVGGGSGEGKVMIYADRALAIEQPTGGATDQIRFANFAFVELDKEGRPRRELSCAHANLWLIPLAEGAGESSEGVSRVVMEFEDASGYVEGVGLVQVQEVPLTWTIPNTFTEKVAFMSWGELRRLVDNPYRLNWVDAQRQKLVTALAQRQTLARIQEASTRGEAIQFADGSNQPVSLRVGRLAFANGEWTLAGGVEVLRLRTTTTGRSTQTITAESGTLKREQRGAAASFKLTLERARVRDSAAAGDSTAATERSGFSLEGLSPSPDPAEELRKLPPAALLERADAWVKAGDRLDEAPQALRDGLVQLDRVILGKQNERMAMAASCAVMVLTGAITALLLSRKLPLTVYLFTFAPALVTMVTISGGQQLTKQVGAGGLALMWAGVAALGLYTMVVYWKLARH
ncbi:MAG TPA: LptF/LptG family permease [Phycisphaerales bacterium]|nr:LptF/LptG family permease [Phycisphaerales bacterium]